MCSSFFFLFPSLKFCLLFIYAFLCRLLFYLISAGTASPTHNATRGLALEGGLPSKLLHTDKNGARGIAEGNGTAQPSTTWHRVALTVSGTTASGTLDDVVLFKDLTVPAPHDHRSGKVAGATIPLG